MMDMDTLEAIVIEITRENPKNPEKTGKGKSSDIFHFDKLPGGCKRDNCTFRHEKNHEKRVKLPSMVLKKNVKKPTRKSLMLAMEVTIVTMTV